jgi:hypothetical protein
VTWLLWRQHRIPALVTALLLGAFTIAVVATGVHMAHQYEDAVHGCTAGGTCNLVGDLFKGDGAIVDLVHLSIVVPALLGILGATLIARETEHSTNVLVWTQSVTRRRWITSKIALALGATLVTSVAVTALVTWWSRSPNSLYGNRFEGAQFDTQAVVPIAFALFAVALGLAAGAWFRRTLPAIAVTVIGFVAVRLLVVLYARPNLLPTRTSSFPVSKGGAAPSGSWTVGDHIVDGAGRTLGTRIPIPPSCQGAGPSRITPCLSRLGFRDVVTYHPPGQYWQIQWIEAGIFFALAAALVTFAVVRTRRRDA